jgi:hypothetical protein
VTRQPASLKLVNQFPLPSTGSICNTEREEDFDGGNEGSIGCRISRRRIDRGSNRFSWWSVSEDDAAKAHPLY